MKSQPKLHYISLAHRADNKRGTRMAYWQWGDPHASHLIVCAHGLTRQGRDFDVMAQALLDAAFAQGLSVNLIAIDIVGRGQSDWLNHSQGYSVEFYVQDVVEFLVHLCAKHGYQTMDWIGTSLGGLMGMSLFGAMGLGMLQLPLTARRLVLNDVGPTLEWSAVQRIATYLGAHPTDHGLFESVAQAAQAMWQISSSFGPHTDEEWIALSKPMLRSTPDGKLTLHYDPAIAIAFQSLTEAQLQKNTKTLWRFYEHIEAQTLLLRGATSDLLSLDTAHEMLRRGYKMPMPPRFIEFQGVGHAPTLVPKNQHEVVIHFLLDGAHQITT